MRRRTKSYIRQIKIKTKNVKHYFSVEIGAAKIDIIRLTVFVGVGATDLRRRSSPGIGGVEPVNDAVAEGRPCPELIGDSTLGLDLANNRRGRGAFNHEGVEIQTNLQSKIASQPNFSTSVFVSKKSLVFTYFLIAR